MYNNYRYIVTSNKVIALSTYAGRTVRGVAKCSPDDEFDVEFGKQLAAARCNQKVAAKRYARARKEYNKLCGDAIEFNKRVERVIEYLKDAAEAESEATLNVYELRSQLTNDN